MQVRTRVLVKYRLMYKYAFLYIFVICIRVYEYKFMDTYIVYERIHYTTTIYMYISMYMLEHVCMDACIYLCL
jgi:hypothetical protein